MLKNLGMMATVLVAMAGCREDKHAELPSSRQSHVRPEPEEALSMLKAGNDRYLKDKQHFARFDKKRIAETSMTQEPYATILACSDSRVPVEHVFDAGIGDLFVVRVAGNVCSDHETGSIEYAVEHLKTPVVVVLGHTRCGAVTAVVQQADVREKFPHLAEHIIPSHEEAHALHPDGDEAQILEEAVRCNVYRSIRELLKLSEGVRNLSIAGKVKIVGGIYDLRSGQIEWLQEIKIEAEK